LQWGSVREHIGDFIDRGHDLVFSLMCKCYEKISRVPMALALAALRSPNNRLLFDFFDLPDLRSEMPKIPRSK
jgi:hypothetical protein